MIALWESTLAHDNWNSQLLWNSYTYDYPMDESGKIGGSLGSTQQQPRNLSSEDGLTTSKIDIRPNDVVFGRGGLANQHRGNVLFRRVVHYNKRSYQETEDATKKQLLVMSIIMSLQRVGTRFLRKDESGSWVEATMKQVRLKTAQALREADSESDEALASATSSATSVAPVEEQGATRGRPKVNGAPRHSTTKNQNLQSKPGSSNDIKKRRQEAAAALLEAVDTILETKKTPAEAKVGLFKKQRPNDKNPTSLRGKTVASLSVGHPFHHVREEVVAETLPPARTSARTDKESLPPQPEAMFFELESEQESFDLFTPLLPQSRSFSPEPTTVHSAPIIRAPGDDFLLYTQEEEASIQEPTTATGEELFPKDLLDRVLGAEGSPDSFSLRKRRHGN